MTEITVKTINEVSTKTIQELQEMLNKNYQTKSTVFSQCVRMITIKLCCEEIINKFELSEDEKKLNTLTENILRKSIVTMTILKK